MSDISDLDERWSDLAARQAKQLRLAELERLGFGPVRRPTADGLETYDWPNGDLARGLAPAARAALEKSGWDFSVPGAAIFRGNR